MSLHIERSIGMQNVDLLYSFDPGLAFLKEVSGSPWARDKRSCKMLTTRAASERMRAFDVWTWLVSWRPNLIASISASMELFQKVFCFTSTKPFARLIPSHCRYRRPWAIDRNHCIHCDYCPITCELIQTKKKNLEGTKRSDDVDQKGACLRRGRQITCEKYTTYESC